MEPKLGIGPGYSNVSKKGYYNERQSSDSRQLMTLLVKSVSYLRRPSKNRGGANIEAYEA